MSSSLQSRQVRVDPRVLEKVLDAAMRHGADFADVFVEESRRSSINFLDRRVDKVVDGRDVGAGIRVIYGTQSVYGYANDLSEQSLVSLADKVARSRGKGSSELAPIRLGREEQFPSVFMRDSLDSAAKSEKIPILVEIDRVCRAESPVIVQVDLLMAEAHRFFQIATSSGNLVEHDRRYSRLYCRCTAEKDGDRQNASYGPARQREASFFSELDPAEFAAHAAAPAAITVEAGYPPMGSMPVIIGRHFGGVIFHEACGHPLETTAIQKGASPFVGKIGEIVANPCVTAVDDGTNGDLWGSLPVDDEGMPTQKTVLIERGVLKSYLVDYLGSLKTGFPRTGSGRRQSYRHAPASRMRNTYIAPGDSTLEEMISSVDRGLFAKRMGGGSVTPGTGDYNFSVQEGYLIEKGKITRPVRGATLIGNGPTTLAKICMVGREMEHSPGSCGSVSGTIPVTVGQPAIKVSEILVGGRDQSGGGSMAME